VDDLESGEPVTQALDPIAGLVEAFRVLLEEEARIQEAKEHLKALMQEQLGDAHFGTVGGRRVVSFKPHVRTSFDQQRFRRDHPELWTGYLRATEVRPFRLLDDDDQNAGQ
jgi:predicted phage-related endonuclease